ncbi:MaoC family dehydratase [Porticoccaceae bacterium]|jgi:acyl dehydratase|nr:MaoC family dehydratase [Porticoccaceae bacterium]|tara:strand:+ start:467 stop:922 length:456 start_codon:yes stop_codon:yes gene_type:complete
MKRDFMAFEDFIPGMAIDLGSYPVEMSEMIDFAKQYDPQPFHTDPETASTSHIGELIASGWFTLSVFMRLQCDGLLNRSSIIVSPGVDNIRWLKPVVAGDLLSATTRVVSTRRSRSKPDRGIVTCDVTIGNQQAQTVATLTTIALFKRREF